MQFRETTLARSTSTKSNDYDFIEKVVEHIPKCTPEDYIRQRNLLNILQAWSQLAEKHNIQYWISSRTLIGYVQHRGLFPYDKDLDVTMMTYDMPQLINISQSNFSFNYEIRIQPQWEIIGYQNRSYFYSQGIPFIAPNARFYDRKTEYFLDI
jgi:phosphorylcholine metabolism protein LicD